MKTKNLIVIAVILMLFTTSSCRVNIGSSLTPSKNFITRDFKVKDFDKLNISTVANVYYTQSTDGSTSLEVYGPDNIVELVKVDIKNNTLNLSMKKKNIKKATNLKIKISSPHLQYIKNDGVGNFHIADKLETASLTIKNDGVGNVKISDIRCTEIDIRNNGVGNVSIKGKAERTKLSADGVGNINADDLISQSVTATANGVGNISCYAKKSINASSNGVGSISYKGNPADKNIKKNGIGSIKQR